MISRQSPKWIPFFIVLHQVGDAVELGLGGFQAIARNLGIGRLALDANKSTAGENCSDPCCAAVPLCQRQGRLWISYIIALFGGCQIFKVLTDKNIRACQTQKH